LTFCLFFGVLLGTLPASRALDSLIIVVRVTGVWSFAKETFIVVGFNPLHGVPFALSL
jgi:hypothetical protein